MKALVAKQTARLFLPIMLILVFAAAAVQAYPLTFTDSRGHEIVVTQRPKNVVSLVPSVTEILFAIGAGDALKGITYHSAHLPQASQKQIVGGFFAPSLLEIEKAAPDLIFCSGLQKQVLEDFAHSPVQLIELEVNSLAQSFEQILLLGEIFDCTEVAQGLVRRIREDLAHIEHKTAKIPPSRRKRVVRLMGLDPLSAPGDDSFQNEVIRAAGGIPPCWGRDGNITTVPEAEWIAFNPQVIYTCGYNGNAVRRFFERPDLKSVEAVKNRRILFFPCELTCRTATHTGYFVSWLASQIYADEFADPQNQLRPDRVLREKAIAVDLPYVEQARIAYSDIFDFRNKTLLIDFKKPLSIVSTLEGNRKGIESVGNHYTPPPCWTITHQMGMTRINARINAALGKSPQTASFLYTGADMDNLAICKETFKDITVYALVTAGVQSNAIRSSKDTGSYYEPGTINIIILTNMKLCPRAMTRAIITATEAKSAALADLDIRSSSTPQINQATGTGTDNILVVQGSGSPIDLTGGHTKMGELIARAVHRAVLEAIEKQNGIRIERDIFQRLKERRITPYAIIANAKCECAATPNERVGKLEEILLIPRYASFIATALTLSDAYEKGLIRDLGAFKLQCRAIAAEIAGREIKELKDMVSDEHLTSIVYMAFNAILNGLQAAMQ